MNIIAHGGHLSGEPAHDSIVFLLCLAAILPFVWVIAPFLRRRK